MTVAADPVPLLTKLIPVPRLTEAARDKEFRELATDTEATGYAVEVAVRALCHPSLLLNGGREAMEQFRHYRNAVLTADSIQAGTDDGHGYGSYPSGRSTNALLDMCDTADGHLRILLRGHPEPLRPGPVAMPEKVGA